MIRKLLPILALIPLIVSGFLIYSPALGGLALLVYLFAGGLAIGPRLATTASRLIQTGLGSLTIIASLSLLGSLIYYTGEVTSFKLFLALAVVAIATSLGTQPSTSPRQLPRFNPIDLTLFASGALSLLGWWLTVTDHAILEPVRSPWLVLNPASLITLTFAVLACLTLLARQRAAGRGLVLLGLIILAGTGLAASLYTLGYGFDPFLHRATVEHIALNGTITPKPLYYIGQYALELIGLKLFDLPLLALDVWLAPVLASFGIVIALASRDSSKQMPIALAGLVFLPLAAFIQTTPQALAFIFTAWAILVNPRPLFVPIIFALAAVITHALAGIAALVYVALLAIHELKAPYSIVKMPALILTTLAASVAVPVAFAIQAQQAGLALAFKFGELWKITRLPLGGFWGTQYNAWADAAYLFIDNAFLIVVALAIAGIAINRHKQAGWYIPGLVALAMFSNFVILSLGFDFTFLIAYERLDFALRLLTLTSLFLLPYISDLIAITWNKLANHPIGLRLGFIVLLGLVFTANVYGAYPRHDNYARSSGFNLSPADLNTVLTIEQHAAGQPYLVLSSQALAAAAVQELGFKQYYHQDIFFYPIPTGGPLYQQYLAMVEQPPSLTTITAALDLTGVDLAYFAVHDYWWQAEQIIENTKALTDDWFAIGDGEITVFVFTRTTN